MPISQQDMDQVLGQLPLGRDAHSVRRRVEAMEQLLEGMFVIPGTNRKVGLDSIVGLIPVVGDLITAAMGAWMIWEARNIGMSKFQLGRMAAHVGVDSLIGAVPIVGDLFDFVYKSNTKNLKIIKKHLDKHHPSTVTIDA